MNEINRPSPMPALWAGSETWTIGEVFASDAAADPTQVAQSGLFDAAWYRATYADVSGDPLTHFLAHGWREGRKPNPYFDTAWYLRQNPDVAQVGVNPLVHYIDYGEAEIRAPSVYFDLEWYASQHPGIQGGLLAHFLARRFTGAASPMVDFDPAYYLSENADIAAAGVDPFEHYLLYGYREGRDPSPAFDTKFYMRRYLAGTPDINPLLHWRAHRHLMTLHSKPIAGDSGVFDEVRHFVRPGPAFETVQALPPHARVRAKILAYYLPQYHAVAENDAWWGAGFTEWTAIGRGMPRFAGHYQPRIPRDLGHYTLGDTADAIAVMRRQVAMAKSAGIFGFVQYFYWFNGRRLLERPLEAYLAATDLDFPFCLMWANENWTRRWDGSDQDVLITQDYRSEDDTALVDCFARHFRDPRYIRIDGRPVLMVYRAGLIPETRTTVARWRRLFQIRHNEDPVLVMSQSFEAIDPRAFGFDGAIEFPPHKLGAGLSRRNADLDYFDPHARGHVFAYDDFVAASLSEVPPDFPLIKTAVPSWDNDARRQGEGLVLHGSTPGKYEAWLAALVARAREQPFLGEPIVCVNAWNEWAEGAYLEPDVHFGAAYLNATARAVTRAPASDTGIRLLVVGHDAFPAGAQMLALNLLRRLQNAHGVQVEYLLLGDGALADDYRDVSPGKVATGRADQPDALVADWARRGFTQAIVNTSAAAWIVPKLKGAGIRVTLLVHEMPALLHEKNLLAGARAGADVADRIVFPAATVHDRFAALVPFDPARAEILPQGSYKMTGFSAASRLRKRAELGLSEVTALVLGAGYGDVRKGFDIFLQSWRAAQRRRADMFFCWIGDLDPQLANYLDAEIRTAEASGSFRLAGFQTDVADWFSAADAFALTSREDPFPTVVLEALATGLPSVAFAGSGGIPDLLVGHRCGTVVPMADADAMARALIKIVGHPEMFGGRGRLATLARTHFAFDRYCERLLQLAVPTLKRISVVVPSYNYARYLDLRMSSIFAQTYPVAEVIVLDDASTDGSADLVRAIAAESRRDVALLVNDANSGSVFRQWRRAAELCCGEFVWIAEADDAADPTLLARLADMLAVQPDIDLVFCDSRAIDCDGALLWPDYQQYYAENGAAALRHDTVFPAREFAERFLAERNMILNVSAVLWRRSALLAALARCGEGLSDYELAGDWRLYLELAAHSTGFIAYVAAPLNIHRRHEGSVTQSVRGAQHCAEIARIHATVREKLDPAPSVVARQAACLAQLEAQLGLTPVAKPARKRKRKILSDQ